MRSLTKQACITIVAVTFLAVAPAAARAEVKATLSKVHLCCEGCTEAVDKAVAKLPEVKCVANGEDNTIVLTADSAESLQKAVNRIARAGFHGRIDNKEIKYKKVKWPEGKVERLEVANVHNCCPACAKAIKAALAKVEGVEGDNCKPKKSSFVIEGDFVAKDAIKALEKAGFHASLPKPKKERAEAEPAAAAVEKS